MVRKHLAGSHGEAANAVLPAVGYNFARIPARLRLLLSIVASALGSKPPNQPITRLA